MSSLCKRRFSDIVFAEYLASQGSSHEHGGSQGIHVGGDIGDITGVNDEITAILGTGDTVAPCGRLGIESDDGYGVKRQRVGAADVRTRANRGGSSSSSRNVGVGIVGMKGDVVDRHEFTERYLAERGWGGESDAVESERECLRRAEETREEFKTYRDMVERHHSGRGGGGRDGNEGQVVDRAEKYERRLQNNRRSAAVSKVYQEVLDKEKTMAIRSLEKKRKDLEENCKVLVKTNKEYEARLNSMADEVRKLKEENAKLRAEHDKMAARTASKGFAERNSGSSQSGGSLRCSEESEVEVSHFLTSQSSQGITGK